MKIKRNGQEYTLTDEEIFEAHKEFITSWMISEIVKLVSDISDDDAEGLGKMAYEMYCKGNRETEYECIQTVVDKYLEEHKEDSDEECTNLIEGHIYRLGGYDWVVAEIKGNCAVLQSCGVTAGPWPGFKMPQFGNGDWYGKNIDGLDISEYDDKTSELYDAVKSAEFTDADYGKGLFLVSNAKVGQTEFGHKGKGNYCSALKCAAENHSSFGASGSGSWLGAAHGSYNAWYVNSNGSVNSYSYGQDNSYVVAPAFNLDQSKVEINGDEIVIL